MATFDPYQYLNDTEKAYTPQQRLVLYNLNPYDVVTNRFGLGEGGQAYLWLAVLADMVALNINLSSLVNFAAAAAALQEAWEEETATITRLNATQITLSGYRVDVAQYGRAVQLIQTSNATGWVTDVQYNSGTGVTTVTLFGCVIDAGLTELWWGQVPSNSPLAATMTGATATGSGFAGAAPTPVAGEQHHLFTGGGEYQNPIIHSQFWGY
jgi:hypothetical protein